MFVKRLAAEKEAFDGFKNAVLKNVEKSFSEIPSRRPANGLLGPEMVDPKSGCRVHTLSVMGG